MFCTQSLNGFAQSASADCEVTRFVTRLQVQVAGSAPAPARRCAVAARSAENLFDCQTDRFLLDSVRSAIVRCRDQPELCPQPLHFRVEHGVSGKRFAKLVLQFLPEPRLGLHFEARELLRRLQHQGIHLLVSVDLHQVRVQLLQHRDFAGLQSTPSMRVIYM